jgi:hypothetical protein
VIGTTLWFVAGRDAGELRAASESPPVGDSLIVVIT